MNVLTGRRLVHVTPVDGSLASEVSSQLRSFVDEGMDVVAVSAPGTSVGGLEESGVRPVPLRRPWRSDSPADVLLAVAELTRLFRRLDVDIVHTHDSGPGLAARLAARAAGVPGILHTVHGAGGPPDDPLVRGVLARPLERLASACTRLQLVQGPDDPNLPSLRWVPADRTVPLGSGVDLERFRPRRTSDDIARARHALGVAPSAVVAGTPWPIGGAAGFGELFATAARMRSLRPEAVFVVLGPQGVTPGEMPTDRQLAEATALGNVVFSGPGHDSGDLHPAFDLFVLPSPVRRLPGSAVEAAASGLPVIAIDSPGGRLVVDHGMNGLLVAPNDVDALAAAVADLATDPARRGTFGARSRAKAVAEFDGRQVIRTVLDAYRCVVLERPARSTSRR